MQVNVTNSSAPSSADPKCSAGIRGGSHACCLASCGTCGGTTCAHEPGGAQACCTGDVLKSGRSCNTYPAPCVIDATWSPDVVAHAAVDANGTVSVLVVAKSLRAIADGSELVRVCLDRSLGTAGRAGVIQRMLAPSLASTSGVTWAGRLARVPCNLAHTLTTSAVHHQCHHRCVSSDTCHLLACNIF
jgi:hypothetical protein